MTKITATKGRKFNLFFNHKNDDLANHKTEGKEKHSKYQEMR